MGVAAWDPTPYPDARFDRGKGAVAAIGLDVMPPTARRWAFEVSQATADVVSTVVSPRFQGPGFVKSLSHDFHAVNGAARRPEFSLVVGQDGGGSGTSGANGTWPSGTPLFNLTHQTGGAQNPRLFDSFVRDPNIADARWVGPLLLDHYIDALEWYIKASVQGTGIGFVGWTGVVTLYEYVDPVTLFDLIG